MSNYSIMTDGEPVRRLFLPFCKPAIDDEEINEVIDTLKSDWITTGPKTHKFEELFKEYISCRHAIAVNSCTAALHLSLVAGGIGDGDEVITSPLTFAATANVIVHQNARPVFADIEEDTHNINPSEIKKKITKKTKAIIPVHYAGHPCEMDEITKIAEDNNLLVIEDAAHAIGAIYKDKKIGTIGDATCFSFYANKNLTTAEGGMVTTNDDKLAEKIRILSLQGISKDAWKRYSSEGSWYYEILYPGYKYNMTDINASLGICQLKKFDEMQKRREEISEKYSNAFDNMQELIPPHTREYVHHAWHLYPLEINTDLLRIDRDGFIEALKRENIGTSVHFIPIHLHPYYRKQFGYHPGDFPNAERFYKNEITLPLFPMMTDRDTADVITSVEKIVNKYKK